jgi:hypothetical protein
MNKMAMCTAGTIKINLNEKKGTQMKLYKTIAVAAGGGVWQ